MRSYIFPERYRSRIVRSGNDKRGLVTTTPLVRSLKNSYDSCTMLEGMG